MSSVDQISPLIFEYLGRFWSRAPIPRYFRTHCPWAEGGFGTCFDQVRDWQDCEFWAIDVEVGMFGNNAVKSRCPGGLMCSFGVYIVLVLLEITICDKEGYMPGGRG
jgi:hypothetical protein